MMTVVFIFNKFEFVKFFLENGVRLKEFVTWDILFYLYKNLDFFCLFYCKLQKVLVEELERMVCAFSVSRVQMYYVVQVLREFLGDFIQLLYFRFQISDRSRFTFFVSYIKFNVRVGNVVFVRFGLCVGFLLCFQSFLKNEFLFLLEKKYVSCFRSQGCYNKDYRRGGLNIYCFIVWRLNV